YICGTPTILTIPYAAFAILRLKIFQLLVHSKDSTGRILSVPSIWPMTAHLQSIPGRFYGPIHPPPTGGPLLNDTFSLSGVAFSILWQNHWRCTIDRSLWCLPSILQA
ncbi:uncharacterized protein BYT42DRAFT_620333, partial [Radiomyces spectabilis]|uniref:uncharacterized protein n=1 Tax=Radiomyces spectabilis TaxID=64574 RepID=UPI00221EECE1